MKKIFLIASLFAAAFSANAENVISVVPFATTKGVVSDQEDIYFEIAMTNDKQFTAFYFDLYLPKGLTLSTYKGSVVSDLTEERFEGITKKGVFIPDAVYSVEDFGGGHYFISLYDSDLQKIKGTSGTIMKMYFDTADDMADGVYPITITGTKIAIDSNPANGTIIDGAVTSYVKVGNPTKETLNMEGVVPSFVNEHLATETAISTLDLSKVTEVNGAFAYVAGRDVVAPAATVEANVKYVAPAPAKYATLCLPTEAEVNCWVLDRKVGDMAIFKESTVAPANTPVIIKAAVATEAAKATIAGVAKKSITSGAYLVGESLHTVNGNATIPALRGYWEDLAGSNCRIAFDTTTGIQVIGTAADIDSTYDLQGRQVQNAQNGVFVVNGKKQFVK